MLVVGDSCCHHQEPIPPLVIPATQGIERLGDEVLGPCASGVAERCEIPGGGERSASECTRGIDPVRLVELLEM